MYGRKVKLRFFFIILILISTILFVFLILEAIKEQELILDVKESELTELENKKIRVGGMVKKNSIKISTETVNFIITDFKNEIGVTYSGVVPNLFSEGKGVVAEGYLKDRNFFVASKILAKHDENYMPPEVKAALEEK